MNHESDSEMYRKEALYKRLLFFCTFQLDHQLSNEKPLFELKFHKTV